MFECIGLFRFGSYRCKHTGLVPGDCQVVADIHLATPNFRQDLSRHWVAFTRSLQIMMHVFRSRQTRLGPMGFPPLKKHGHRGDPSAQRNSIVVLGSVAGIVDGRQARTQRNAAAAMPVFSGSSHELLAPVDPELSIPDSISRKADIVGFIRGTRADDTPPTRVCQWAKWQTLNGSLPFTFTAVFHNFVRTTSLT